MPDFEGELEALGNEWRTAVTTGTLDREKFASLQRRAAQLAEGTEAGLRLLAGRDVTDAQLEALQIVPGLKAPEIRARLSAMAKLMSEYGAGVRAAPNVGQVGRLALPPPEAVVPGELTIAGTTREYNPNAAGMDPGSLANRLSGAGYTVQRDGAVLRLLPPGEDVPRYLMLPAAPDMPPPALARLVTPPGRGAADVLRTSRTNVAIGLHSVQAQTAVPSLEQTLTAIAKSDPEAARALLDGLGRHFKPGTFNDSAAVRAWQGIAHFLEIGGRPQDLADLLGSSGQTNAVRIALGRFAMLRSSDIGGIEAIVSMHRNVMDRVVGIASRFEEPNSVFAGIGLLKARTESGFDQLVEQLASPKAAERQQALDAMVEGVGIVVRSPTRRLRFEMRSIDGQPVLSVRYPGGGGGGCSRPLRRSRPAPLQAAPLRPELVRRHAQ
jgi:hypothetical protein